MSPIRKIEGKTSKLYFGGGYIAHNPDILFHHSGRVPVLQFNSRYNVNLGDADYVIIPGLHGGEMVRLKKGKLVVTGPCDRSFSLEAVDAIGRFIPKGESFTGMIKRRFLKVNKGL